MSDRPSNAFLRSLSADAFQMLAEHLTPVDLTLGQVLCRTDQPVDWVYFPERCLLSVLTQAAGGNTVETAMVGTEGALLLLEACGSGVSAATCLAQVDGRAWRAPASACRSLFRSNEAFARSTLNLVELQMIESRQSGLCQALHSVEPRFGRWLLESMERSGGRNPMPLTQEFIASMLGVQRTTVTAFAIQLQKAGLIDYSRGVVKIKDAEGLEQRACECRAATREQRARLGLQASADMSPRLRLVGT